MFTLKCYLNNRIAILAGLFNFFFFFTFLMFWYIFKGLGIFFGLDHSIQIAQKIATLDFYLK